MYSFIIYIYVLQGFYHLIIIIIIIMGIVFHSNSMQFLYFPCIYLLILNIITNNLYVFIHNIYIYMYYKDFMILYLIYDTF